MTIEHDLRVVAREAIRRNREAADRGEEGPQTCRVAPVPLLALVQRCERLRRAIGLLLDAQASAEHVLTDDAAAALLVAEDE